MTAYIPVSAQKEETKDQECSLQLEWNNGLSGWRKARKSSCECGSKLTDYLKETLAKGKSEW